MSKVIDLTFLEARSICCQHGRSKKRFELEGLLLERERKRNHTVSLEAAKPGIVCQLHSRNFTALYNLRVRAIRGMKRRNPLTIYTLKRSDHVSLITQSLPMQK